MFYKLLLIFSFTFLLNFGAAAQNPAEQTDVVRIETNLIQVDAVVTDKDGNQVTGLKADDFQIFQDGKPQRIQSFSYIKTAAKPEENNAADGDRNESFETRQPPASSRAGRVITFVIDDGNCTATTLGINAAREGLEKFINEQMLPDDLVAIYQTRAGSNLLQQYTSDKTRLRRIIGNIGWTPQSACDGKGGDLFAREKADNTIKGVGIGRRTFESRADRATREMFEDDLQDAHSVAAIEVLRAVTRRLKGVGGRKIVFFLSDGLPVVGRDTRGLRAQDLLRDLIAEANQAAIVFNAIDARGQFNASLLRGNDEVLPEQPNVANPTSTDRAIINRIAESRSAQDGLKILSEETGGSFSQGKNLLDTAIRDLLNLEKGYYLLAYQPDEAEFKGKKYHRIEIKLKNAEWRVLSRSVVSALEQENKPANRTQSNEVFDALNAPLPAANLNLRVSAFFGNTAKDGNFVYSVARLKGREISFVDDAKGYKKAVLEVTAVLLDEKNKPAVSLSRTHTIRVSEREFTAIREKGLIYPFYVSAKEAGTYDLRVAVRDSNSRLIGSASQTVVVPDLRKKELFFSTVSLADVDQNGMPLAPESVKTENGALPVESATPRFRRGSTIAYIYTLYNPAVDKKSGQPKLTVQTALYRNGKTAREEKAQIIDFAAKTDWTRIDGGSYLKLAADLQTGDYSLRVTIKDLTSDKTTQQWVDFELID